MDIPRSMGEITPAWLTDALGREVLGNASVVGARVTLISEGVGFLGEVARIDLDVDPATATVPTSVIAKIPSGEPEVQAMGLDMMLYERESAFYRFLASEISTRVPRCFYNGADPESGDFVLLLENLGHLDTTLRSRSS